jgi:hypothetical protein
MYSLTYRICSEIQGQRNLCSEEAWEMSQLFIADSWKNMAVVAFLPVPFAWLWAYIFIGAGRWVNSGLNVSISWARQTAGDAQARSSKHTGEAIGLQASHSTSGHSRE